MSISSALASVANVLTGGVVDKAMGMIDKLIPDKNLAVQLKAQMETLRQVQTHELEMAEATLAGAQIAVNTEEAKSASLFIAGWRPAIGWIGAVGLGWNFILQPLATWAAFLAHYDLKDVPSLNISDLMALVTAMLGIAGLRSIDKFNGVSRDTFK